jgi:hypothetical protein
MNQHDTIAPTEEEDDLSESSEEHTISRRHTIKGIITGSILSSVGMKQAAGQIGSSGIKFTFIPPALDRAPKNHPNAEWPDESSKIGKSYERPVPQQYEFKADGTLIGSIELSEVSISYAPESDASGKEITASVQIRPEFHSTYSEIASATKSSTEVNNDLSSNGRIDFGPDEFWGDPDASVELIGSGAVISTTERDNHMDIDESTDTRTNNTSFEMVYEITSSDGEIAKQQTMMWTLCLCRPLGFGAAFGLNFGKSVPPSWPSDFFENNSKYGAWW